MATDRSSLSPLEREKASVFHSWSAQGSINPLMIKDAEGVYVTLQAYPLVPRDKGVLRATPTVANTWEQVEHLCGAIERVVGALRS